MLGFIGKMFGSEKALDGIVSGVSNAVDALHYSEEEKADNKARAFDQIIKWQEATQGQNLARRFIALSVVFVWLLQYLVSQVLSVVSVWVSEPDKYLKSAELMRQGADDMGSVVMLIMTFYFTARATGEIATAVVKKWSK
jgi:hypothetical protein